MLACARVIFAVHFGYWWRSIARKQSRYLDNLRSIRRRLLHSITSNAVIFSGALLSEFSTPFIRLLDLVRMATTIGTGQMFCFGLNFNKYYSSSDTIQLAI